MLFCGDRLKPSAFCTEIVSTFLTTKRRRFSCGNLFFFLNEKLPVIYYSKNLLVHLFSTSAAIRTSQNLSFMLIRTPTAVLPTASPPPLPKFCRR